MIKEYRRAMKLGVIVTGGTIAATADQHSEGLYAPQCGSELMALTENIGRDEALRSLWSIGKLPESACRYSIPVMFLPSIG